MLKTRNRTNPVFRPQEFAHVAGEERAQGALEDPDSVDLLTWNVFSTLESHSDPRWLAGRLQQLAGPGVREPVRLSLWTGREREPLMDPPASYIAQARERAHAVGADDASVAEFTKPVGVPVRLESPDVLGLIDTLGDASGLGRGGRDRVIELIDVGLEQARRVGKTLAVAVVYRSGTTAASEVSVRINTLRDQRALAAEMPHRRTIPPVVLREMSWQQLLRIWQGELDYLDVDGLPVKSFLAHCQERGLL